MKAFIILFLFLSMGFKAFAEPPPPPPSSAASAETSLTTPATTSNDSSEFASAISLRELLKIPRLTTSKIKKTETLLEAFKIAQNTLDENMTLSIEHGLANFSFNPSTVTINNYAIDHSQSPEISIVLKYQNTGDSTEHSLRLKLENKIGANLNGEKSLKLAFDKTGLSIDIIKGIDSLQNYIGYDPDFPSLAEEYNRAREKLRAPPLDLINAIARYRSDHPNISIGARLINSVSKACSKIVYSLGN